MDQPLFDSEPPPAPRGEASFSVAQLGELLSGALSQIFPDDLWVEGEISNISRSRVGHVYFDLIEPATPGTPAAARISVVLFSQTKQIVNAQLKRQNVGRLIDGMSVRIRAAVDYYPPQGRLQLRMTGIDPRYILATMAAERDALIARLHADGVTERNKQHPMPLVPQRIGLVTSRGSAAEADFMQELQSFTGGFNVTIVDARVQGDLAPRALVAALRTLYEQDLDVIAVIRGGGSRGDLAVFDNEQLALTISEAPVPVVVGVGHEIDRSVADVVAHSSFKTPTAVAADLGTRSQQYCEQVEALWFAVADRALATTAAATRHLASSARRAALAGRESIERADQRLVLRLEGLPRVSQRILRSNTSTLDQQQARLKSVDRVLRDNETHLDLLDGRLRAVDPDVLLARGWSITRTTDGTIVRHTTDVAQGDTLVTNVADGSIISNVTRTDKTLPETSND